MPRHHTANVAYQAVHRHIAEGRGDRPALRFAARAGRPGRDVSYAELAGRADRFAAALRALGARRLDRVATLLDRGPELYPAVLGTLRNTSVVCPLPPGLEAGEAGEVARRLRRAAVRVLVTTEARYLAAVAGHRDRLPDLEHVLITGPRSRPLPGTRSWDEELDAAPARFAAPPTGPEDVATLHFTGGATGPARGVVHVHGALAAQRGSAAHVLDPRPDDVYWSTADPGTLIGTVYGLLAPLALGLTVAVEGEGDAPEGVTVRHAAGAASWGGSLRRVLVTGESPGARAAARVRRALGVPVVEGWWQTETGGLVLAGDPADGTPPGSLGRPLPGVEAALLAREGDGTPRVTGGRAQVLREPSRQGFLAFRPAWPSMFHGYLDDKAGYESRFLDGWYLTGDIVRRDADGWYWFVGRAEDVISAGGQLVSPVEVEAALGEHPAVGGAVAVGKEGVTAYVTLAPGFTESDALREELHAFCRYRLGPVRGPRRIVFAPPPPRTAAGMIVRRGRRDGAADG